MADLFVVINRRRETTNDLLPKVEWRALAHTIIELIESSGADEIEGFFASPIPHKYGWLVSIADTEVEDLKLALQQGAKAFGESIFIMEESR